MGGNTYGRSKKQTAAKQRVTAKAKLNILGYKRGDYGGRFTLHGDLLMEDGLTTYSGTPTKTAQLSEQLDKALSFLSSPNDPSSSSTVNSKSASAYKVSLKNNVFARKVIKLSTSIKIDQRKSLLKKAADSQKTDESLDKTVKSTKSNRRKRKKKVKSNNEVVARKIASILGEGSSEVTSMRRFFSFLR
jgi:hypothetical protein